MCAFPAVSNGLLASKVLNYNHVHLIINYAETALSAHVRACQPFLLLCSNGGCRRHRAVFDGGEFVIGISPQENFGDEFQGHNMHTITNFVDRAPLIFVILMTSFTFLTFFFFLI